MRKETIKAISALEEVQLQIAVDSMEVGSFDPFQHGIQVGRYRGISEAIAALKKFDREDDEDD